jgi:hypothetical protein
MALYTPFIERNIDKIAKAIDDGNQKKLAQGAYMGDQAAMSELAGVNPQLAQQIQQSKNQDAQQKLQMSGMEQSQKFAAQNQNSAQIDKLHEAAKTAARMPFEQAAPFLENAAKELGIDAPPLTQEHYNQIVSGYGDRLTEAQKATLEIQKQQAGTRGDYNQQMLDLQNRRLDEQSLLNDARIKKLENPTEKPLTDSQSKALVFGSRMQESDKIINDLAAKGVTRKSDFKTAVEGAPLIGGALGAVANSMQSDDQQMIDQSQRDFINAVLRRESGASISPGEFDSAKKQYFPSVGDSPAVMKQKAANRALATKSMLQEVPESQRFSMSKSTSAAKAGGVLHVDAQGNKAIVYPDGSYEEVQ